MAQGMQEECLGGLFLPPHPSPVPQGEASKAFSQLGTGLHIEKWFGR